MILTIDVEISAKKEALIIIARKLAYIIWAIYNHNKPYNPARVFVAHP